ncbi:PRC-barrel domain-containing protein [Pseudorhodoplanes sp.]|uniref:PRC-barrel domain-containing protein n=1 Tax=Pseudorhodoplanes sp. TaxID=1934341 RepID=UPI003D13032A
MKTYPLIVAATLLATPVLAQTTTAPQPNAPAMKNDATMNKPMDRQAINGQWRASKLIGVDVYNNQNEKLGEINELILTSNGQVSGAVIGVGGFLGMGERDVMVPLDKLTFSNDRAATTGAANDGDRKWYPDRAVLNTNKDQLKGMPEFKY